jgi:hypothetical protein
MRHIGTRLGIRAGVGMAVTAIVLAIPGIASATTNEGTFSTGLGTDGSTATTRLYLTSTSASTCVDVTSLRGAWHFILSWRNGGADTHLFQSRSFTASGIHCSPTESIPGNAPKVFDEIITTGVLSQANGNYSITTN